MVALWEKCQVYLFTFQIMFRFVQRELVRLYIRMFVVKSFWHSWFNEEKCFVTFIDDFSRHISVYPILRKSDVFHMFIKFYNMLKTETGFSRPIYKSVSDNGTEYLNQNFEKFFEANGIQHFTSNFYAPQYQHYTLQ